MRLLGLACFLIILGVCSHADAGPVLFPNATEVRVTYGDGLLGISPSGKISAFSYQDQTRQVKTVEGGALTPEEIALLRRSVSYSSVQPPESFCCFLRHAFVFFDKTHKVLGQLQVCFQCRCAMIIPEPTHDKAQEYLAWDRQALAKIVRAHHLPLRPKE
jgi:hypothetical protein